MTTKNIALAKRVYGFAKNNPAKHNQGVWFKKSSGAQTDYATQITPDAENECGTQACLAGWTVSLSPVKVGENQGTYMPDAAARLLGMDYEDQRDIFYDLNRDSALVKFAAWIDDAVAERADA